MPRLARVAAGVHRLERQLLVVLDVDRVLDIGSERDGGVSRAMKMRQGLGWSGLARSTE